MSGGALDQRDRVMMAIDPVAGSAAVHRESKLDPAVQIGGAGEKPGGLYVGGLKK